MLNELIAQLKSGVDLGNDHTRIAVEQLTAEAVPAETKANFLTALAEKGESAEELAAFASELRGRATPVPVDDATRDRGASANTAEGRVLPTATDTPRRGRRR